MELAVDPVIALILLTNFRVLGTSRIAVCVRAVAVQGVLLSVLPLLLHQSFAGPTLLVAAAAAIVKGFVIPAMLLRTIKAAQIREVDPYVGFVPSILLGAVTTAAAVVLSAKLPLAPDHHSSLVVPGSLATLLAGFLILTTRRKAINQVIGYLMLENGVFIFGMLLLHAMPFMVEVGVLLDVFVGVFIMGIVVDHIRNEFSSLDTEQLSALRG